MPQEQESIPQWHIQQLQGKLFQKITLPRIYHICLGYTPSMVVSSDAGTGVGYTNINIRGTDVKRINVTIDGIPVNDAESHGVWWVDLPDLASSADNIQIQRGVGTSTNGAGAFGATINFQTTSLNREPYAEVNSSYGSFNTSKNTVNFGTGLINNKFAVDARLSKIWSDGYIDRAFSDLKSFYISGTLYGETEYFKTNDLFRGGTHLSGMGWCSQRFVNNTQDITIHIIIKMKQIITGRIITSFIIQKK